MNERACIALAIALIAANPAVSADPDAHAAAGKVLCEERAQPGDATEVRCVLNRHIEQRIHITVHFSGGHDDTMASMVPRLDDTPVVCEPGSKTSLFGEDGDVSLACRFRAERSASAAPVLHLRVQWSHAQYVGFEVVAD